MFVFACVCGNLCVVCVCVRGNVLFVCVCACTCVVVASQELGAKHSCVATPVYAMTRFLIYVGQHDQFEPKFTGHPPPDVMHIKAEQCHPLLYQ